MSADSNRPILVVDDNADACAVIAEILRQRGLFAVAVEDPTEARRLVGDGLRPALLLTDFVMPGCSGTELVDYVRSFPDLRWMPAVVLTGARLPQVNDPLTLVLRKPFDPDALSELVSDLARP